jgi:molybdopterin synthase catalytic subunit
VIEIVRSALIPHQYLKALDDRSCGGLAVFEGRVRDHNEGRAVASLEYECYEPMALLQMEAIRRAALQRWGLGKAMIVHRVGAIPIGEGAVWIGAMAPHRAEAFEACRFMIDEVKVKVPIWKRESYVGGGHSWVGCAEHSHTASR